MRFLILHSNKMFKQNTFLLFVICFSRGGNHWSQSNVFLFFFIPQAVFRIDNFIYLSSEHTKKPQRWVRKLQRETEKGNWRRAGMEMKLNFIWSVFYCGYKYKIKKYRWSSFLKIKRTVNRKQGQKNQGWCYVVFA